MTGICIDELADSPTSKHLWRKNSPPNKGRESVDIWGDAMNGDPLRTKVCVTNPQGFHMRPLSAFSQLAGKFASDVYLYKTDEQFDGKSPFSLLGLAAEQGTELILEVQGPDQETAFEKLLELWDNLAEFGSETTEITGE